MSEVDAGSPGGGMQAAAGVVRRARRTGVPRSLALSAVACAAAALWLPSVCGQTVTDLGTLGGAGTWATGINAGGEVVGYANTAESRFHAFVYANGVIKDLGTLGGALSYAYGINDSGDIVGTAGLAGCDDDGCMHAFLYSQGIMTDLGTLGGTSSTAVGINTRGDVVGWSQTAAAQPHAFLYSGGVMTDLGTLPGDTASYATGINGGGEIVGYSGTPGGVQHAFLYANGAMTGLGTLGGGGGVAMGINAGGQVAGFLPIALPGGFPPQHAFRCWGGDITDLGALGGGWSYGYAINAGGQVVGAATVAGGAYHAFLYSNGLMIDLNTFSPAESGWLLWQSNAVNDYGQIAGFGSLNGQTHGFLFNPISVSPSSALEGSAAFTLTVNGVGTTFLPGTAVQWNGTALPTKFMSGTEVTASVPAGLVAAVGSARITVASPAGAAGVAMFAIHPPRASPQRPEPRRGPGREAAY